MSLILGDSVKIIFLDIDGVLNSQKYFIENRRNVLKFYADHSGENYNDNYELTISRLIMNMDKDKLLMLRDIILETGAKVVVVSSWKTLSVYEDVAKKLIEMGIPIIDKTSDNNIDRGTGIYNYLMTHDVNNYVILDDEIFSDYDENLLSHLIKTSFYRDGLTNEHAKILIKRLK